MTKPITVKIVSKLPVSQWQRYFSDPGNMETGGCRFITDPDTRDYDWVVVYNDLPKVSPNRFAPGEEALACSQENTLFVVAEPENVKQYPKAFTRQFTHVLTAHSEKALPHPGRIFSQPALVWFYGRGFDGVADLDYGRISRPCMEKTQLISTVCSSKQQKHTLHNQRFDLTEALRKTLPEMEVFGHGVRAMADKAEALDPYRYHIAIENFSGKHHWTEKLSDCFLGCCLPFYSGCTNLEDYFPPESYIEIDLWDEEKTTDIIRKAMAGNAYEKRLSAIKEARRLVLEEYSFFTAIAKIIQQRHSTATDRGGMLYNRAAIRTRHPFSTLPEIAGWELKNLLARFRG